VASIEALVFFASLLSNDLLDDASSVFAWLSGQPVKPLGGWCLPEADRCSDLNGD